VAAAALAFSILLTAPAAGAVGFTLPKEPTPIIVNPHDRPVIRLPDLRVSSVNLELHNYCWNSWAEVTARVRNDGAAPAGPSVVRLTTLVDSQDLPIGNLAVGQEQVVHATMWLSNGLPFASAEADAGHAVFELNEGNNFNSYTFPLQNCV
jgi:hypothetical protein